MNSVILFLKSHVAGYMRAGRYVKPHERKGGPLASASSGQLALFPAAAAPQVKKPLKEMIDEHERLVDVLNSPSHADDKAEAKKQAAELEGYKRKQAREAARSTKQGPTDDEAADPLRKYYVTMAREGRGVARLAGPFDTHDEALALVDRAREEAEKADPRSTFDSFGTAGVVSDNHRPGVLNERLGLS